MIVDPLIYLITYVCKIIILLKVLNHSFNLEEVFMNVIKRIF